MTKRYSTNNEYFDYDTPGDVLDALESEGRLRVGEVYYEADSSPVGFGEFLGVDGILEHADERLYEEIGEVADNEYSCVSSDAKAELATLLRDWERKHVSLPYWRIAGSPRELRVTADDVADHSGAAEGGA